MSAEKRTVPHGWKEVSLGEVVRVRSGTINPSRHPGEEFELYSIPGFDANRTPEVRLGSEIGSNKVSVEPGDCLFSRLNPRINRVWLVPKREGRRQVASTEF